MPDKGRPLFKKHVMNSWNSYQNKGRACHEFVTLVYGNESHVSRIHNTHLVSVKDILKFQLVLFFFFKEKKFGQSLGGLLL